ncbi:MAG: ribonuclease P protein component [Deltaproteobacteria bacterium]|nr:ribonuclease P protein component [Deltaproteobacteria bacterium]
MAASRTSVSSTSQPSTNASPDRGKSLGSARVFPRSVRLRGRALTDRIFKTGRYHGLGLLQAKSLPRSEGEPSRFLISIRKSVGNAPLRNRIKRVVREALRLNRNRLLGSYDICLFITRRPERPVRLGTVEPEILRLFARLSTAGNNARNDG